MIEGVDQKMKRKNLSATELFFKGRPKPKNVVSVKELGQCAFYEGRMRLDILNDGIKNKTQKAFLEGETVIFMTIAESCLTQKQLEKESKLFNEMLKKEKNMGANNENR